MAAAIPEMPAPTIKVSKIWLGDLTAFFADAFVFICAVICVLPINFLFK